MDRFVHTLHVHITRTRRHTATERYDASLFSLRLVVCVCACGACACGTGTATSSTAALLTALSSGGAAPTGPIADIR